MHQWLSTISVVATLLAQTAGIVWWASGTNERVANHEKEISQIKIEAKEQNSVIQDLRLAVERLNTLLAQRAMR